MVKLLAFITAATVWFMTTAEAAIVTSSDWQEPGGYGIGFSGLLVIGVIVFLIAMLND